MLERQEWMKKKGLRVKFQDFKKMIIYSEEHSFLKTEILVIQWNSGLLKTSFGSNHPKIAGYFKVSIESPKQQCLKNY